MTLHDGWAAIRHGGNLLSPSALDGLPARHEPWSHHVDQLRDVLAALPAEGAGGDVLGTLLDTVLESLCGLKVGWRKGSHVRPEDAERLLDGTLLKPRRVFSAPGGDELAVFTSAVPRLGVGVGRRPVAHVVEYLRKRSVTFAILTNGREWRFVWVDADSLAWAEWDADRWLDADRLSVDFEVFHRIVSWPALAHNGAGVSPLVAGIRETRRGQAKLSSELGENVRRAVETLLRARSAVLPLTFDEHKSADLYVAACHLVMRLVVVLFAEARELLPADNAVYHRSYGLRGLIDQLARSPGERRKQSHASWARLLALFRLIHEGSPHPLVSVQAYGGELFKAGSADGAALSRAVALFETNEHPPDDETVFRMLLLLTRTHDSVREGAGTKRIPVPVDFSELTSEYIGILYEGLLDYELRRAGSEPIVFLGIGDQPALPLNRLEAMDNKALAALVEKAKPVRAAKPGTDGEEESEIADDNVVEADDSELESTATESETIDEVGTEAGADDDSDEAAPVEQRTRLRDWARRAVVVGKLVQKTGKAGPEFDNAVDRAARGLIADVKWPGELFLVRWGGTRKGAGTFYTRPKLASPTVRRTLEPLLYSDGQIRAPEQILALKVCDPAMGSGSFLVAALRVLADAVTESLYRHERITTVDGATAIDCEAFAVLDRAIPASSVPGAADERLEALVRRAVVEHCLYGVDLDPLAVELGRVALWVETLDRHLPFTFLDHKLRRGNALIGTWLDRFRDYPLLAFNRESPDRKWKGVHHQADEWHHALKLQRARVIDEQVAVLSDQASLFPASSDEELKVAVARIRRLYRDLREIPAGLPHERARIWRDRIQPDPALAQVRRVFDTWCAVWFWPLDQIDRVPGPRELHSAAGEVRDTVQLLQEQVGFFHWELEFPDVFTEVHAGFDAVVGNPPWEIQKPNSKEFFSNLDPLYRAYGKQEALAAQHRLFQDQPAVEHDWLAYNGGFKDRGAFVRFAAEPFGDGKEAKHGGGEVGLSSGERGSALHRTWRGRRAKFSGTSDPAHPFRHQGSADLNTYKMFIEVGHALLRRGGQVGMIVPSGIYTDKGTSDLRRLFLEQTSWRWLYGFENRERIFDIHRSFKFCICIAEKGGTTQAIRAAFMRHDIEDWANAAGVLDYPAERVAGFSPQSLSVLEIRSERDLSVLSKLYANGVLLGDEGPDGWGIKYGTEFHMTNDSKLFIPREKAEADGFVADIYGRWVRGEEVLLPLYEGRMIGQFDFSQKGWVSGKGRTAVWREVPWADKRMEPQFLLEADALEPPPPGAPMGKALAMEIASATNLRTGFASLAPYFPAGHKTPVYATGRTELTGPFVASFNSLAFDATLRMALGSISITWHVLEMLPLPLPFGPWVLEVGGLVRRLNAGHSCWALWWWQEARNDRLPWRRLWAITPHERLRLRCMIDAIVAVLYGLDREDFAWILRDCDHPAAKLSENAFCRGLDPKGFWRVDREQDPELRHPVLSLVAFDDLSREISTAGSRDAGIEAFCAQNDGDGWMLPEQLSIAALGMVRSVDVGQFDAAALESPPVRARMGERFLEWQLAQSVEESWAECEMHAKALASRAPAPPAPAPQQTAAKPEKPQLSLFGRPQ